MSIENKNYTEPNDNEIFYADSDKSDAEFQNMLTGSMARKYAEQLINNAENYSNHHPNKELFIDDDKINLLYENNGSFDHLLRLSNHESRGEVEVPLHMIVSADTLRSWNGRAKEQLKRASINGEPSREHESKDVIDHYADLPAATAPAIDSARLFLFPDGRVLIKSHNAHRTAGAKRRGDKTIKISGDIEVYYVGESAAEKFDQATGNSTKV